MARKRTAAEERKIRVASAFRFANMALRVAGEDTSVIRKEKGKHCVRSEKNPDWSGGCYDTRGKAEDRLEQVEAAKHAKASRSASDQDDWVPGAGGTEEPFTTRDGRRLQYMWQPSTGNHAYYDLDSDLILSEEESRQILGTMARSLAE